MTFDVETKDQNKEVAAATASAQEENTRNFAEVKISDAPPAPAKKADDKPLFVHLLGLPFSGRNTVFKMIVRPETWVDVSFPRKQDESTVKDCVEKVKKKIEESKDAEVLVIKNLNSLDVQKALSDEFGAPKLTVYFKVSNETLLNRAQEVMRDKFDKEGFQKILDKLKPGLEACAKAAGDSLLELDTSQSEESLKKDVDKNFDHKKWKEAGEAIFREDAEEIKEKVEES